jgi:hypothetical protein
MAYYGYQRQTKNYSPIAVAVSNSANQIAGAVGDIEDIKKAEKAALENKGALEYAWQAQTNVVRSKAKKLLDQGIINDDDYNETLQKMYSVKPMPESYKDFQKYIESLSVVWNASLADLNQIQANATAQNYLKKGVQPIQQEPQTPQQEPQTPQQGTTEQELGGILNNIGNKQPVPQTPQGAPQSIGTPQPIQSDVGTATKESTKTTTSGVMPVGETIPSKYDIASNLPPKYSKGVTENIPAIAYTPSEQQQQTQEFKETTAQETEQFKRDKLAWDKEKFNAQLAETTRWNDTKGKLLAAGLGQKEALAKEETYKELNNLFEKRLRDKNMYEDDMINLEKTRNIIKTGKPITLEQKIALEDMGITTQDIENNKQEALYKIDRMIIDRGVTIKKLTKDVDDYHNSINVFLDNTELELADIIKKGKLPEKQSRMNTIPVGRTPNPVGSTPSKENLRTKYNY